MNKVVLSDKSWLLLYCDNCHIGISRHIGEKLLNTYEAERQINDVRTIL